MASLKSLSEDFKNSGRLTAQDYQSLLAQQSNLSYNDYQELLKKTYESKQQIQMDMKYKIFNVKDLLAEIQYEGVRKGTKTEAYLEDVIASINRTGKYRWVQFFQLVDVFYVVVELSSGSKTKTTTEEIQDHYADVQSQFQNKPETKTEKVEKVEKAAPVSLKTAMPWKK
jgi:hypothetical protein